MVNTVHLYASLESQVYFTCNVRIVHVYPITPGILLDTTRWPADRAPIEIMEVTWASTPTRVPNMRSHHLCEYQNYGIIYGGRSLSHGIAIKMQLLCSTASTAAVARCPNSIFSLDLRWTRLCGENEIANVSRNINLRLCKVQESFISDG